VDVETFSTRQLTQRLVEAFGEAAKPHLKAQRAFIQATVAQVMAQLEAERGRRQQRREEDEEEEEELVVVESEEEEQGGSEAGGTSEEGRRQEGGGSFEQQLRLAVFSVLRGGRRSA
jgi:hypothetical protein